MAKIIIRRDAEVVQEVQLSRERMTIGRHPHNDIVIEHRAVSGAHAAITTILNDAFLEDLGSTNGTFVNGQRIAKHVLADRDQIVLAKFQIEFIAGPREAQAAAPPRASAPAPAPAPALAAAPPAALSPAAPSGRIDVLNGNNAGRQLALNKPLTTLGRPGVMVVAISRAGAGYSIAHLEGEAAPTLNGQPVGRQPVLLADGDEFELAGTRMAFRAAPAP